MTDLETIRWTAKELQPLHRQEWLTRALGILQEDFLDIGETIPININISVTFLRDTETLKIWGGQYRTVKYANGVVVMYIYVNPTMNGLEALDTFVHELVHAIVGKHGHCERFHEVAEAIGMTCKGTYSNAKANLSKRLAEIHGMIGAYPSATDYLEAA
jgi:hypothetical protein